MSEATSEVFKRTYTPNGKGGYHVEDEEVPDVQTYSGWTLPTLDVPWQNYARFSIWVLGMVSLSAAAAEASFHAAAWLEQLAGLGSNSCTISFGR